MFHSLKRLVVVWVYVKRRRKRCCSDGHSYADVMGKMHGRISRTAFSQPGSYYNPSSSRFHRYLSVFSFLLSVSLLLLPFPNNLPRLYAVPLLYLDLHHLGESERLRYTLDIEVLSCLASMLEVGIDKNAVMEGNGVDRMIDDMLGRRKGGSRINGMLDDDIPGLRRSSPVGLK